MSAQTPLRTLTFLALALLPAAVGGDDLAAAKELRTFVVYVGQPEVSIEINGKSIRETDADGNLRFSVEVAAGDEMHFRALSAGLQLDAVRTVPVEDPEIPILWDLSSQVRAADRPDVTLRDDDAGEDPAAAAAADGIGDVDRLPDECRGRKSLKCMQAAWTRFTDRVARGQCRSALEAAEELIVGYPELRNGRDTVASLAAAYLDCGLAETGQRRRSRIRRSIDLLEGYREGELWCDPEESRVLARGYETLGEIEAAAQSAARAQARCGDEQSAALEWHFYFRVKLGQLERSAELADRAPRRLGLFLRAWMDSLPGGDATQDCRAQVELNPSGDLPCAGLPREFCSRQYGRILLHCGTTRDDFVTAARYLRASLPLDPRGWEDLAGESRSFVVMLAEAEYLSENFSEAARSYEELLSRPSAAGPEPPGEVEVHATLLRRYADSLVLAHPESSELERALETYQSVRKLLASDAVALATVVNNICVLRSRLGRPGEVESEQARADLESLAAALEAVPEEARRLRLLLRISLLTLQVEMLELDTDLSSREKLKRLQKLRAPFEEYREEIENFVGTSSTEIIKHKGRLFALALP
ncbi:MAG: hypothetical protein GY856_21615 [bacterium]|nr:hypothetical protein [bacterium]